MSGDRSATLKVLIADDEMMARRRLRRLLEAQGGVDIVCECKDGQEALRALEAQGDIDVAILDIQMPGLSGLDVTALRAGRRPLVVFATAHPEHALAAFDVGAVDYVVKPIEAGRLRRAVERARERLAADESPLPPQLALEIRGELRLLDSAEIAAATFDGQLVNVHYRGELLLTELSLSELERRLPPGCLERVHRRALLNLAHVDRLRPLPTGGFIAVTRGGQEIPVSRQSARELRKRLLPER
jgi:two-component system, LytTR family, response regulator